MIPIYPESAVALNENTKPSGNDSLYVTRIKLTATLQVSAISNGSTDMKRIYVFKKSVISTSDTAKYHSYNKDVRFQQDGKNNYYYAIPSDQKNNAVLNLIVNCDTVKADTAVVDQYYFVFTDNTDFDTTSNTKGILVGPAQIHIIYGALTETTGFRINNALGIKPSIFDLVALTNRTAKDTAIVKDMKATPTGWDKSFYCDTSLTMYAKMPTGFDYTHATDLVIKKAYYGNSPAKIQTNVVTGDLFVAKIRAKENYALIHVTYISDPGSGGNTEYMEFSVKK